MDRFLTPGEVDELLSLQRGKAKRLAKKGVMPALILPDGTVRFNQELLRDWILRKTSSRPMASPRGPGLENTALNLCRVAEMR